MRHDFASHFGLFHVMLKVSTILEHLKKNREEHLRVYEEAKAGYLEKAAEELTRLTAAIADGKLVKIESKLKLPVNYVHQYDQLIQMFELATNQESYQLTLAQYRCIVDDAWSWTDDFNFTNSTYSAAARAKLR